MTTRTRYRIEDGRSCIDLNVRQSRQLFDGRDPAPFHERDLDDDAVAYLLGAAQEIPRKQPLAIVVTISDEPEPRLAPDVIVEAVRGHFTYEGEHVERRLREHVRRGQMIGTARARCAVVGFPCWSYGRTRQSGTASASQSGHSSRSS